MRIKATKVFAKEIKAGELFSTASQTYWDHSDPMAIGEKVYIRTDAPTPKDQANDEIYRVEILN